MLAQLTLTGYSKKTFSNATQAHLTQALDAWIADTANYNNGSVAPTSFLAISGIADAALGGSEAVIVSLVATTVTSGGAGQLLTAFDAIRSSTSRRIAFEAMFLARESSSSTPPDFSLSVGPASAAKWNPPTPSPPPAAPPASNGSGGGSGAAIGGSIAAFMLIAFVVMKKRQALGATQSKGENTEMSVRPPAMQSNPGVDMNTTSDAGSGHRAPQAFEHAQLSLATDGFSKKHLLDEGAFGAVFRGVLQPSGAVVAIKVLKATAAAATGASKTGDQFIGAGGFRKELDVLSQYRHINVVRLLGHCLCDTAQCLVFEFMEGGSLSGRLAAARAAQQAGTPPPLTPPQRFAIASDVARGLEFLHVDADPPIIHQDVKSANILLCSYQGTVLAKLADFGTARFAPKLLTDTHHATCNVVGTGPYMPLEYTQMGHVSEKTDTFAFGVVLCELLTGDTPSDRARGEMLSQKMYEPLQDAERELPPLLDGSAGAWPLPQAVALGRIARRCIEMAVAKRCIVVDVLAELDALAGREAVVRAGRGMEYDPMTGELVQKIAR